MLEWTDPITADRAGELQLGKLRHGDPGVREIAADLASLRVKRDGVVRKKLLKPLMSDPDFAVRESAAKSLSTVVDAAVAETLLDALEQGDSCRQSASCARARCGPAKMSA